MQDPLDARVNNFDFMRLSFALLVIYAHSYPLAWGSESRELFHLMTCGQTGGGAIAVDGFFFISGYLVTGSLDRSTSIWSYLKKRMLRIYPAFLVVSLVDLVVVLPLSSGHLVGKTIIGKVALLAWKVLSLTTFASTGSFASNPYPEAINGSLWTIRVEFLCYLGLALLGVCGMLRRRYSVLAVYLISLIFSIGICFSRFTPYRGDLSHTAYQANIDILVRLVPIYLAGVVAYLFREKYKLKASWAICSLSLLVLSIWVPNGLMITVPSAGSYLMISFAYCRKMPLHHFARYGDFSYGTYLYAFPIQQLIMRASGGQTNPLELFGITTPLTLIVAALSWHFVEKRFVSRSRTMH